MLSLALRTPPPPLSAFVSLDLLHSNRTWSPAEAQKLFALVVRCAPDRRTARLRADELLRRTRNFGAATSRDARESLFCQAVAAKPHDFAVIEAVCGAFNRASVAARVIRGDASLEEVPSRLAFMRAFPPSGRSCAVASVALFGRPGVLQALFAKNGALSERFGPNRHHVAFSMRAAVHARSVPALAAVAGFCQHRGSEGGGGWDDVAAALAVCAGWGAEGMRFFDAARAALDPPPSPQPSMCVAAIERGDAVVLQDLLAGGGGGGGCQMRRPAVWPTSEVVRCAAERGPVFFALVWARVRRDRELLDDSETAATCMELALQRGESADAMWFARRAFELCSTDRCGIARVERVIDSASALAPQGLLENIMREGDEVCPSVSCSLDFDSRSSIAWVELVGLTQALPERLRMASFRERVRFSQSSSACGYFRRFLVGLVHAGRVEDLRALKAGRASSGLFARFPLWWSFVVEAAMATGRTRVLDWVREGVEANAEDLRAFTKTVQGVVSAALRGEQLESLKWAEAHGAPVAEEEGAGSRSHFERAIDRCKSAPLLAWLLDEDGRWPGGAFEWPSGFAGRLAERRQFELLRWARSPERGAKKCPWDADVAWAVVHSGARFEEVSWVFEDRNPVPCSALLRKRAAAVLAHDITFEEFERSRYPVDLRNVPLRRRCAAEEAPDLFAFASAILRKRAH